MLVKYWSPFPMYRNNGGKTGRNAWDPYDARLGQYFTSQFPVPPTAIAQLLTGRIIIADTPPPDHNQVLRYCWKSEQRGVFA